MSRTNVTPLNPAVSATAAPVTASTSRSTEARHPELLHERLEQEPLRYKAGRRRQPGQSQAAD